VFAEPLAATTELLSFPSGRDDFINTLACAQFGFYLSQIRAPTLSHNTIEVRDPCARIASIRTTLFKKPIGFKKIYVEDHGAGFPQAEVTINPRYAVVQFTSTNYVNGQLDITADNERGK
jgi:hypothetical protein